MWRGFLLFALCGLCLGLPAAQNEGSLDSLITNVFGPGPNQQTMNGNAPNPIPTKKPIDDVIKEIFPAPVSTTTQGTILGINNTPKTRQDCECVLYYQCTGDHINDSGFGLIDVRLSQCPSYMEVCCAPPNVQKPDTQPPKPEPKRRTGCGKRNVGGVAFRITGQPENEAQFGEFPWMVAILGEERINDNVLKVYQCGGALIHEKAVLTAAHCVYNKQPAALQVRAGEWDTQSRNEAFPHQDRNVEKVIVHENFISGSLHNDFAILILKDPVEFADNVDVVCLPEAGTTLNHGLGCIASGWGKDLFGKEGHYQVILKKVELPVVARDTCENIFRTTRLGKYFRLHESFICAGGNPGKDTCTGDGGGPLVCPLANDPARYIQAGIVAWGIGCGSEGIPGAYANIAYARPWIDEQMADNGLDTTRYQYRP